MTESNTPSCSRCGAGQVVAVVYGYPDFELMEQAERGEVTLAESVVRGDDDPRWHCRICNQMFG